MSDAGSYADAVTVKREAPAATPRAQPWPLWTMLLVPAIAWMAGTMWPWAANVVRHTPPIVAGAGLTVWLILLVAPARALDPLRRLGDALVRGHALATTAWIGGIAGLVLVLPDRVHFVGDFMLREFAAAHPDVDPQRMFPQALPLDVASFTTLPRWVAATWNVAALDALRGLGALCAAALAVVALVAVRWAGLAGLSALVAASHIVFTGSLALMTGYGKAFGVLFVLGAAMTALGTALSSGRNLLPWLGVVTAVALALHRASVVMLPLHAALIVWFVRRHGWPSRGSFALAIGLPLATLAVLAPRFVEIYATYDVATGYLRAWSTPNEVWLHLLDATNIVWLFAPGALAFVAWRDRSFPVGWAIVHALPVLLLFFAIRHATQGLFRDWDLFAGAMATLSVWIALRLGALVRDRPERERLAPALIAAAIVPCLLWLANAANVAGGLRRVEAFAVESPVRPTDTRARIWSFLSARHSELGDYEASVRAGERAVTLAPSRQALTSLANAQKMLGRNRESLARFEQLVALDPRDAAAWHNVALLSASRGDFARAAESMSRLEALPDTEAHRRSAAEYIARMWERYEPIMREIDAVRDSSRRP